MQLVGSLGHTSEGNTGLIYMRARYYDPALGRFISEDPAMDGVNWFVYCRNNPVNLVDEDGRMAGLLVGSPEAMAEQAENAANTIGFGHCALQAVQRAMLLHGATIYAALKTGGDVMVQGTRNGVSLYNSAGNHVFIHLANFHSQRGTGAFYHFDVGGTQTWKAIMKAFERLAI